MLVKSTNNLYFKLMNNSKKQKITDPPLIWERAEPIVRPAPIPLSRDKILNAAIVIADDKGLSAVSLRKVAAALNVGPMRLYGYMSTKEEMLDLMVDEVYGEIVEVSKIDGDWQAVLRSVANCFRSACLEHQWLIDLLGGRPHMGPNALIFLEMSYQALRKSPVFADINTAMHAMNVLNAFALGAIRNESAALKSGMSKSEWQSHWWPYLERKIATGQYPMLKDIALNAEQKMSANIFNDGLETLIIGLEKQMS